MAGAGLHQYHQQWAPPPTASSMQADSPYPPHNPIEESKRMRTGGDYNPAAYPAPGTFVPPAAPVWGHQGYMAAPTAQYDPYGGYPVPQVQPVPMPVAPAGYAPVQDLNSAVAVHNNLQGAVLTSSDRGGMRIQYSKNPYGRKKDASGPGAHAVDGVAPGVPLPDLNGATSTASQ